MQHPFVDLWIKLYISTKNDNNLYEPSCFKQHNNKINVSKTVYNSDCSLDPE